MILGPYTVHPGVIWENEFPEPSSAQQVSRTILGNLIVKSVPLTKNKIIISTKDMGTKSRGVFTRDIIVYLKQAELDGSTVPFTYRGASYNTLVASP